MFADRAGDDRLPGESRRVIAAGADDADRRALFLRAGERLRVAPVGNALALDPALRLGIRCEQRLDPLVRAKQAEEQNHRAAHGAQLGRKLAFDRRARQMLEGAVVDDVDLGGVDADVLHQPPPAVF